MVLATTVMMLAALVAFQKPVAVDVEIHCKAVISEQQSFGNYPPPCHGDRSVIHTTDESRGT
jgi:hypothetical protein